MDREYKTIREIKERGEAAVGKMIKELVTQENVDKWYASPRNKGWLGNAVEKDWFGLANNSRPEADFNNLGVELKCAGLKFFKKENSWGAKERLVLNIFDFNEEYERDFQNSSFLKKSKLVELMLYKYNPVDYFQFEGKEYPTYPDFLMTHSILFNLNDLLDDDWAIIENDWNIIMDMIRQGRAEDISEGMTQYLGAVTKGSKTAENQTTQPFSDKKAHRRAFSLRPTYMKEITKRIVQFELKSSITYASYQNDYPELHKKIDAKQIGTQEHVIKDLSELKHKTFEQIILDQFKPFYNMDKEILAAKFSVRIKKKNDKASSRLIAQKMFNLKGDLEETDEFKKAGIAVKTITVESNQTKKASENRLTTEGFKLESDVSFINDISNLDWEDTRVYDYLSTTKFLLVVYEETPEGEILKGAKFWYMPEDELMNTVKKTWEVIRETLINGVELTFKRVKKSASNKKGFKIENNLPSQVSGPQILHIRPSANESDYFESKNSDRLPSPAIWKNRPEDMKGILTDNYMVKQALWLNKNYMYQQVKEFFE
ncbi:MutH/Sau3AI family endonuclease [Aquibacillus rhizosphaerae]|uniref:MutH/Sau3AI family endonuclease n=1 Tax=Aquibacillus rhizosphaerae TaxID=3051431 RepID=A0ABT7LBA3_9BACI|nr:MutH/Sau3AI family endonuclease [Aquibacillus sp. LR5S19]MDL4842465.1 MutH/Sau3AI family endonuclease [Aquibacillus sp. LR5S19]